MSYTLVRHTGWSVGGNPQFENAVELTSVDHLLPKVVKRITHVGGLLFDSYGKASSAEMDTNYPDEDGRLIPNARGTFSKHISDIGEVYIPKDEDR